MFALFVFVALVCTTTAKWHLSQKLSTSDGGQFGRSVSISDTFAVVGAPGDDAVYVYEYKSSRDEWNQSQKIFSINPTEAGAFGISVSIFDNRVIIGDTGKNKAYIYKLNETNNNNTFYQIATLTASAGGSEIFGQSAHLTDGYAIVGDRWYNSPAGISYIFIQNISKNGEERWIEQQSLEPSDLADDDEFGRSVSISYKYAIVGSRYDDDNGDESGSAYIFELNENTMIWEQVTKITASDGLSDDQFGFSVSIDFVSGLAIIGARKAGEPYDGASYIFQRNETSGK